MKNTRAALAVLSLASLASLAACGGGSSGPSTALSQTAQLRIIAGSPDAGPIDIHLGTNTGGTFAGGTSLAYGTVTAFQNEPTVSQTLVATGAGATNTIVSCNLPQLQNNQRYTVVIAGKVANGGGTPTGTQCQFFQEPTFTTPTGQASVTMHHASPAAAAAGAATIAFGNFTPGSTNYQTYGSNSTATFVAGGATATGTPVNVIVPPVTTGNGTGVYVATQGAPTTPLASITPSRAQIGNSGVSGASDTSNFLPYQTLVNFSVYVIDGQAPALVNLVGAFD